MRKQITLSAALISLATVASAIAQIAPTPNDVPMPPVIESPEQIDEVSGIKYCLGTSEFQPAVARPSQALLTEIVCWLSANFDLPAFHDHPRVELVTAMKLAAMRYKGLFPDRWREDSILDPAVQAAYQRTVVAVYNDTTRTIFLPVGWTGTTPADLSVLVHEMVHHLQNLSGLKYECPGAREKLAYQAQDQWLKRYHSDLEQEFELDMLTLLVSSVCTN